MRKSKFDTCRVRDKKKMKIEWQVLFSSDLLCVLCVSAVNNRG